MGAACCHETQKCMSWSNQAMLRTFVANVWLMNGITAHPLPPTVQAFAMLRHTKSSSMNAVVCV